MMRSHCEEEEENNSRTISEDYSPRMQNPPLWVKSSQKCINRNLSYVIAM